METTPRQSAREPDIHDSRLDDRVTVASVDFENPLHSREADHYPAADSERSTSQARTGPPRHERHVVPIAQLDQLDDVFGTGRKHDHIGDFLLDHVAVALEDQELIAVVQDVFAPDDSRQVGQQARGQR